MKKIIFAFISVIVVIFFCVCTGFVNSSAVFGNNTKSIIIDAGHGLPDGGAVASDGTIESDINLKIAQLLNDYLTKSGFECIMTRTNENSVYTEGETIHAKKVSDIRNRIKIANKNPNSLVVSIHMNTFTTPDVHGAQVFYKSGSEISKEIAGEIQRVINLKFQPENTKVSKPISSNVYLFNHIDNDSVLIECGFLTNSSDLENLKSEQFQQDIAKSIAEILTYKLLGSEINAG